MSRRECRPIAAKKLVGLGCALWSCCIRGHLLVIGGNPEHCGARFFIFKPGSQSATFFRSRQQGRTVQMTSRWIVAMVGFLLSLNRPKMVVDEYPNSG